MREINGRWKRNKKKNKTLTLRAKAAPGVGRPGHGNGVVALFALAYRVVVHLCAHRVFVVHLARVVLETLFPQPWNHTRAKRGSVTVCSHSVYINIILDAQSFVRSHRTHFCPGGVLQSLSGKRRLFMGQKQKKTKKIVKKITLVGIEFVQVNPQCYKYNDFYLRLMNMWKVWKVLFQKLCVNKFCKKCISMNI